MKNPFKHHHHQQSHSLLKKLLPYTLYAILPIALFRLFFNPSSSSSSSPTPLSISSSPPSPPSPPPPPPVQEIKPCDYTQGTWVPTKDTPLYNGTTCGSVIKDGQNCQRHGQSELTYLFWKWNPSHCTLPRFNPSKFFTLLRGKHIAFVGDSMARNQAESLVCLLSSAERPHLVYATEPDNKFRRWHFPIHNLNLSVYWSPFLVRGIEKSASGPDHNKLYLDSVDEKWGSELGSIHVLVLSIGHWYLHPAVYYEAGSVLGCHACDGLLGELNHTEIGFYGVFRKAHRAALRAVVERGGGIDHVLLTTFSPSHFEGEWDKAGACPRTRPYAPGEKGVEGMDAEMRNIGLEEIEKAGSGRVKMSALDVTGLAMLRPDAHPGPYMHPFPFANGVPERVQHDCLHWCLPGAIDTWNEIMLELIQN